MTPRQRVSDEPGNLCRYQSGSAVRKPVALVVMIGIIILGIALVGLPTTLSIGGGIGSYPVRIAVANALDCVDSSSAELPVPERTAQPGQGDERASAHHRSGTCPQRGTGR